MTSNKSFLWSLTPDKEQDVVKPRDSAPATSTFLWRTSSSAGVQTVTSSTTGTVGNTCSVAGTTEDSECVYDDVGGASRQDVYDDAGFEDCPPEKPARTSSTRSSATSGIWSSPEQFTGDSGSAISDDMPRYEEPSLACRLPEVKTAAAGSGSKELPAGLTTSTADRMSHPGADQGDSVDGAVNTRPTSVKLLAMRFEAMSHHDEEPRKAPSKVSSVFHDSNPAPKISVTLDHDDQEVQPATGHTIHEPQSERPRLPTRSSSSLSSSASSSSGPPAWRRPPPPAKPTPPPLRLRRHSFSSSDSDFSPYNSPPPSPPPEMPPPPPPLSTLPSRNNSRVQEPKPQLLSPKDKYENVYETLRGSIEMETYANEPLYQIYNQNAEEMAREYISREFESSSPGRSPPEAVAMSCKDGSGAPRGQFRTLWCQLPEVRNNNILDSLSAEKRKLMEAKFEIITSEASYISSLNILKNHFMVHLEQCNEQDFCKEDRRLVFGDVIPVRKVAEKMLSRLEACRKKDVFMSGMLQAIHDIARDDLKIYVDYCAYQNSRTRTLDRLMYQQPTTFAQTLAALEAHPVCQGLTLQSFLLVPMQRITKLQLLVGAVLTSMDTADEEYYYCRLALQLISDVVHECNEGVRAVERMEELLSLSKQIKFDRGMKMLPLYCSNRWLVKRGKVTELNPEWFSAKSIYLFIFNDILFIAKKRKLFPQNIERFLVVDYCNREDVRLMNTEGTLHLPERLSSGFCMLLTLIKNHRQKKVSKLIYFSCESDRQRWTEALNPPQQLDKESKEWPQVVVKWAYVAEQPDELSLSVSDIITVFTRSADGWYQGQRLRDGETGWFPGNYTVDVEPVQLREHSPNNNVVMSIYYV